MFALSSTFGISYLSVSTALNARPWFSKALREENGSELDVGAKKQIRHLSALFEGCNRAKIQSREESQVFRGVTDNEE